MSRCLFSILVILVTLSTTGGESDLEKAPAAVNPLYAISYDVKPEIEVSSELKFMKKAEAGSVTVYQ